MTPNNKRTEWGITSLGSFLYTNISVLFHSNTDDGAQR